MKNFKYKYYILVALLVFLGYISMQVFSFLSRSVETEKILFGTADISVEAEGLIIRNDNIITSNNKSSNKFLVADGEKINSGGKLAISYPLGGDVEVLNQINDLNFQIEQLQKSSIVDDSFISDSVKIEEEIVKVIAEIKSNSNTKSFTNFFKKQSDLQVLFNKKQIVLGQIKDVDTTIKEVTAKRDDLMGKTGSKSISTINAPMSGYFSTIYDGYENILSPEFIKKGGYEKFKEVFTLEQGSQKPETFVCKIVSDFVWYFGFVVQSDSLKQYSVGQSISLRLKGVTKDIVPANIESITKTPDGDYILVSSNYFSPEILKARKEKADIITNIYNGLKINKNALRIVDDKTGVFSVKGSQIQFKPVNVLYSTDEYAIISQPKNSKANLLVGEEIVITGKNLFDGKIIK